VEVWHGGAIMKRLKDWQIIGKILSIIWLLGAVVFSTKTVGEERLKFRVLWHETCLISNELRAEILQKYKNLDKKNDECFIMARQNSITAIPDHILLRKIALWGILPILFGWIITYRLLKSGTP